MAGKKPDEPGPFRRGFDFKKANPDGIYSGSTKRLAITDGSFAPGDYTHPEVDKHARRRER